ncbi:MAG: hypothetical protein FJY75_14265 [Candidatus Eisenbacteria bacterium]|uniref:Uncharacterized protein n=1 Tax=Eiseniibacteriota bacterium TaxID=2212470 RepID=A0A938BS30_UNCEI|nr:hypothetical protein [Candidatus Eisenbacteria bacterium]
MPEIPLTRDTGTHARALGMGGAYVALSEDAGGLRYNPAGLARVMRPEFSGSFTDISRRMETDFEGVRARATLGRTHLTALGFVYPFPTYRGSMVIAFGYSAPALLDRDYVRRNYAGSAPADAVSEEIFEEGQVGEWSFGYAVDVSPTLSLGLRASWVNGGRKQDWLYRDENFDIHDFLDTDVRGFTGSLGAQTRIAQWGRAGLTVDLPRWLWIDGSVRDIPGEEAWTIDEDLTLPFSVAGGLSAAVQRLLLAADARYTDWTRIDYAGPLRYESGDRRRLAYRRTWNLHLGAEYLLDAVPSLGMRLRAGLALEPVPYRVLLEEIGVGDDGYARPLYREADFDPDRLTWTAGLGLLLQQSLTLDLAYARGGFKRSGVLLAEKETEQRLLVSAAFRLN